MWGCNILLLIFLSIVYVCYYSCVFVCVRLTGSVLICHQCFVCLLYYVYLEFA